MCEDTQKKSFPLVEALRLQQRPLAAKLSVSLKNAPPPNNHGSPALAFRRCELNHREHLLRNQTDKQVLHLA